VTVVVNFFIYIIDIRGKRSLDKGFKEAQEGKEGEDHQQEEEANPAKRSLAAKRSFAH